MSTMNNDSAEQLWYTWSDVGLSTVHAGFRIRAASPGLTEIYSERVKSIDRYMRYVLPPGTDPFAITPDMAPICLAFIRTDSEYILVHKKYVGEDGVGRLGNFFVHVIAFGNPTQIFSTTDAIWLWGSDIWKMDDKEQDRRSNKLEPIPLKALQSQIANFQPNYAKVRQCLPFVIEAYLTRKNKSSLYIAASADNIAMIAFLIAGLANWLPRQLVAGLTFSTYEPDVTKAATEIVGTSWIPTPGKVENTQVFSPQFYRENLAVNCFTGDRSLLQGHPQITPKPLAADFATYATECLITNNTDQLKDLLELAEKSQTLDVDTFLRLYYNEIANTDSIGEADIDKALADPGLYLDRLSSQNFRKRIIESAAADRLWSTNQLYPRLLVLRNLAQQEYNAALSSSQQYIIDDTSGVIASEPAQIGRTALQGTNRRDKHGANTPTKKNQKTLAQALFMLADRAITDIVKAMKSVGAEKQPVSGQSGTPDIERQKKTEAVMLLLPLMDCCLLPQNSLKVWKDLFDQTTLNRNTIAFLTPQWEIFAWLLKKWDDVFPPGTDYDIAIRPLLIIPWSWLGAFLKLNLRQRHGQWNVMVVERLINDASLTPQTALALEQNYSTEINNLLTQLLQEAEITIAASFVVRLIENGYPTRPQFATLVENLLMQFVRIAQFWSEAKNLVVALTRSGYMGTPSYQDLVEALLSSLLMKMQAIGQDLFDVLVDHGYPRKKNLVDILIRSNTSMINLESVIERVYRTPDEVNAFFISYGSQYLSTLDQVRAMRVLYQRLLQQLPQTKKLERLFVLLSTSPDGRTILDGNAILELINSTPLEGYEPASILAHYGKTYLKMYKQTPQLADTVVRLYIQLVKSGYPEKSKLLFKLITSATDPGLLENLLLYAQLSLNEQIDFLDRYGEVYLSTYPQSLILKEYISTYVSELNEDSFERAETQRFITFLAQQLQLLNLDTGTQSRILWWKMIDSYLISPDATPARLRALTTALLSIGLPKKFAFTTKLAKVFVSCVRTSEDLSVIISFMQQVRNIQVTQLLYLVAEQVAALYRQSQDASLLIPYLSFVLSNAQISFLPSKEGQKYFRYVFLDTLLCYLNVLHTQKWMELSTILTQYTTQFGNSDDALEQWHDYLKGLQLLERLQSNEGIENGVATPVVQLQPSPALANDTKHPSLLARFQLYYGPPEYREAKNALARALGSKQVDIIALAWWKYGAIIDSTNPNRVKPHQRDKINVSRDFEQYYQAVSKTPNGPIDYANKLVELSEAIELLSLQLSQDQVECVERARLRVQYGGKQPYQNPVNVQPGPVSKQNSSPGEGQGPNPLELNRRSVPRDVQGQQSSSSTTNWEMDEGPKPKKREK